MAAIDYEAEYDNRARVSGSAGYISRYARDAAAYRATAKREADVAYGPSPRQIMDIFFPAQPDGAPVCMFIHGGYWRAFDHSTFSHMAKGLVGRGAVVAIPSYDLCPYVSIATILDQVRAATLFLWRRYGRRVTVVGHSAGGHLAAALMATDWPAIEPGLHADLVPACHPISALPDLTPLVHTSMNADFNLDDAEARRLSPLFWPAPAQGRAVVAVGENESDEYLRQTRDLVAHWRAAGREAEARIVSGMNHFTVIAELTQRDSRMVEDVWRLATE